MSERSSGFYCTSGAFDSTYHFISEIVLPNFQFFEKSFTSSPGNQKAGSFRSFYNSVVSMNSILDYLFWECLDLQNIINNGEGDSAEYQGILSVKMEEEGRFRNNLYKLYPVLSDIHEIANALKHCKRKKTGKIGASTVFQQSSTLKVNLELNIGNYTQNNIKSSSSIETEATIIGTHLNTLKSGFSFWINYGNFDASFVERFLAGEYHFEKGFKNNCV